jgi:SAM-dependent methyltransferase
VLKPSGERRTPGSADDARAEVQDLFHRFPYHYVATLPPAGGSVLEVGFGEGYGAPILTTHSGEYIGIEVSEDVVRHARRRYANDQAHFGLYDGATIPFAVHSFDLVVSFHVLEHLIDVDQYMCELRRVCHPDGLVVLVTPNRANRVPQGTRPWNRFHTREYDPTELAETIRPFFPRFEILGIHGSVTMETIERDRIGEAQRLAKLDPLGLRYRLPEWLLVRVRPLAKAAAQIGQPPTITIPFTLDDIHCDAETDGGAIHLMALAWPSPNGGSDRPDVEV